MQSSTARRMMTVARAKMEITMNTMRKLPHNNNTNEAKRERLFGENLTQKAWMACVVISGTRASAISYYNYFLLPSACKKLF